MLEPTNRQKKTGRPGHAPGPLFLRFPTGLGKDFRSCKEQKSAETRAVLGQSSCSTIAYLPVRRTERGRQVWVNNKKKGPIEIYAGGRFFTTTGSAINTLPIREATKELEILTKHADDVVLAGLVTTLSGIQRAAGKSTLMADLLSTLTIEQRMLIRLLF